MRDYNFFSVIFWFHIKEDVQKRFGSRKIFSKFNFKTSRSLNILRIKSYCIHSVMLGKINGAFVMKMLRNNNKLRQSENFFCSNDGVQSSKSGIVQNNHFFGN